MTQEDKELLLKDLSARLGYGVKCQVQEDEYTYIGTLCRIEIDNKNGHLLDFAESMSGCDCQVNISKVKPYLFPLSSMTDKQKLEYRKTQWIYQADYCAPEYFDGIESFDWCYKNNFDCRGLIPKGRAIDATNLNIY